MPGVSAWLTKCCYGVADDDLAEFDAELTIRQTLWKNEKLLPPLGERMPIRKAFDKFLFIALLYTGFFTPLNACFQIAYHPAQLVVDYLIDGCYILDMLLTWRTAYYDEDNLLVIDKAKIRGTYLRRRFLFDLLANIPWELLALAAGHGTTSAVFAGWRLWRLLRFVRLRKLHPSFIIDVNASTLRRFVNFYPLVIHWVACVWYFIGLSGISDGYVGKKEYEGGSSWLTRPATGSLYLAQADGFQRYISSLYWSASALMKTPWIAPSTVTEKVFACVIIALGALMFAVFLGQIYKIIERLDEGSAQRREKMGTFRTFCQHNKLSAAMTKKVIGYAMAEWNVTRGVSTIDTLKILSPTLGWQLLSSMRQDIVETCPLFSQTSLACMKQLLTKTTTQVCLKNEYAIGYDELARELFIILKGSLQVNLPAKMPTKPGIGGGGGGGGRMASKKNLLQFRMLEKQGATVGVWKPQDSALRFPYEVQAKEFTVMLNLGRLALLDAMGAFEDDRPKIASLLEKEHDLCLQALKLVSSASTRGSSRKSGCSVRQSSAVPEAPVEEELDEAAKEELATSERVKETNETLSSITSGLNRVHGDILGVRQSSSEIHTILSTLGVDKESLDDMKEKAATLVSTASGRRGSGPRLSISPVSLRSDSLRKKPQNERLTKRADDRSREEEMREIKASSKEHRSSGATAAIVL